MEFHVRAKVEVSLVEHLFDQGVCRTVGTLPDISHDAANVCKNSTYIRNRPAIAFPSLKYRV